MRQVNSCAGATGRRLDALTVAACATRIYRSPRKIVVAGLCEAEKKNKNVLLLKARKMHIQAITYSTKIYSKHESVIKFVLIK